MKREDDKRFHFICEWPIIPFSSEIISCGAKNLKVIILIIGKMVHKGSIPA